MPRRKVKKTCRRWTQAEIVQVKLFIESGMSDKKIAREVGRTEGAIKVFRRYGRPSKPSDFKGTGKSRTRKPKVTPVKTVLGKNLEWSRDRKILAGLIFESDVTKEQKLACLEALL